MMKKDGILHWDDYFMGLAIWSSFRSKDDHTRVGACIADSKNRIISLGYNGMPNGCKDEDMPWNRMGKVLDTKYMYVVHAEVNAVLNSSKTDLSECRIYVTLFPCHECTKILIQCGIKEIIYFSDKYEQSDSVQASRLMLKKVGIQLREYQSDLLQNLLIMESEHYAQR